MAIADNEFTEPLTKRHVEVRHQKGRAPMALLSDLRDLDLEKQVRLLSNEIASLKKLAARRGNNLYGDASDAVSDYYADLSNIVSSVLPSLRKQSRVAGAAASNHPAAVAAVGLVIIGLVVSVFLTRRPSREPGKTEPGVRKRTPSRAASSKAASSRTARARAAPTRGRKPVDARVNDAAEPNADKPPDSEE